MGVCAVQMGGVPSSNTFKHTMICYPRGAVGIFSVLMHVRCMRKSSADLGLDVHATASGSMIVGSCRFTQTKLGMGST